MSEAADGGAPAAPGSILVLHAASDEAFARGFLAPALASTRAA